MTYDTKCYDLAKLFLMDVGNHSEVAADQLAQEIQSVIEEFLNDPEHPRMLQS